MRIALIQFNAGSDKQDNWRRAAAMIEEAASQGASLILLPEVFLWRGNTRDPRLLAQAAETMAGPHILKGMALARGCQAHVLFGSVFEKAAGTKAYNTSILIAPDGRIAAKYRKIHLFDARIGDKIIRESDRIMPGRRGSVARVGDFTLGLSVCYDLRFPALYGGYARLGANVLTVPSCFTKKTGQAHWEVLLRARAIENLSYVLAPNQVGKDAAGVEAYGNSMVVSPWGEVLACGSAEKEEIVYGDMDMKYVIEARKILPGVIQ